MRYICLTLLIIQSFWLSAQMQINGRLLYGHEWIEQDQAYYAIPVAEDGIYRLQAEQMMQAGIPVNSIEETEWQLWQNGMQVPILIGLDNDRTSYIEFKGSKNRIALDSFLTEGGKEDLLNHEYSLINDTATYYLSWKSGSFDNARIRALDPSLINPPVPEAYIWSDKKIVFTEGWSKPYTKISGANIYMSNFERGEGFASPLMQSYSDQIDLEQPYLQGPEGKLSIRFTGDYDPHEFSFTLNGEEVYRRSLPTFTMETLETELDSATMSAVFQFELKGELNSRDRFHMAHITADYPAQPHMPAAGSFSGRTENPMPYFEIPTSDERQWYYYDLKHNIRYNFRYESGNQKLFTRESPAAHAFIWATEEHIKSVPSPEKQEFRTWDAVLASDYIILTSERLYEDGSDNPVQQYADYRAGEQGGEYSPAIVNVEDIYTSFGYGITRHPQAIRNFAHFLKAGNPNNPSVFIIGKGREYRFTRTAAELADPNHDSYFVPTFGYPSSDNLLFAASGEAAPIFPLGRLSIESKEEIVKYLDKVKAQESPVGVPTYENSYWRKRVVQLVGGGTQSNLFDTYLSQMASNLEGEPWNPEVFKYSRESNLSIEKPVTDVVFDHINEGAGLVTFLGHSSTNSLGFDINIPSKYENAPRFPFLIAMGCYGGNLNTSGRSVGELYSSFEGGGFIGSIATSSLGEVTKLYLFSRKLYEEFGENAGHEKVGTILLKTLRDRQTDDPRHSQQIMYYGDPVLSLFQSQGPDYTFNQENISITPYPLEAGTDSFTIEMELVNIGSHQNDTVRVDFERKSENSKIVQRITKYIPVDRTKQIIQLKWPTGNEDFNGKNTLFASIDPQDSVKEYPSPLAENNNSIQVDGSNGFDFFILSNGIKPGWPYDFSIVGVDSIQLKGVTSDPLSETTTFLFELDTLPSFHSTFKKSEIIKSKGGVIEWQPEVNWEEEKVYYWRTAIEPAVAADTVWNASSFVYIPGHEGWNQSHIGQFVQSDSIFLSTRNNRLELPEEALSITIKNLPKGGSESPFFLANGINVGSVNRSWNLVKEGIAIAVIDTIIYTLQANTGSGLYNSVNDGPATRAFVFRTNTTEDRGYAINFIENIIPDNSDAFIYTIFDNELQGDSLQMKEWAGDTAIIGTSLIKVLEERGARVIKDVVQEPRKVYNFFYHQYPNRFEALVEDFLFSTGEDITNTEVIGRRLPEGYFLTPPISLKDEESLFSLSYEKLNEKDSIQVNILSDSGLVFSFNQNDSILLPADSTGNGKPFQVFTKILDPELRSSLLLKHLRFYQSERIDLCWAPNKYLTNRDSLEIGEMLSLKTAISPLNIKPASDTIPVRVSIAKNSQTIHDSIYKATWNDTFYVFDLNYSTKKLSEGQYNLSAIINPYQTIDEYNFQNNNLLHVFNLNKDKVSAIINATFDGRIIRAGDIVSRNPEIEVLLRDYNAKTALDTSFLYYVLEMPNGDSYAWRSDQVHNDIVSHEEYKGLSLHLRPHLNVTGEYLFSAFYSEDTSLGSPIAEYNTYFRLVNESTVQNARLYPNPVLDNEEVYLQYNIQSSSQPTAVSIEFYDMLGRKVFEFYNDKLNIQVGHDAVRQISISPSLMPGNYIYDIKFFDAAGNIITQAGSLKSNAGILNIAR